MKKLILYILCCGMMGCVAFEKKQQEGAAVELNGHYLYQSTLDSLTVGLNSEDSLRVTQQFISQWAKDILMYDNAKDELAGLSFRSQDTQQEIERLVEDYRRALYVQAYENYLVERRMSKTVPDSTVEQVYTQMPERFALSESIVKGMLVIVPNDAPNIAKLRQWMGKTEMDHIEKYAYQNATGYDLFSDRWLTTSDLLAHLPIERKELEAALKSKNQIELSDTLKTYLLQITDKHLVGSQMPLEVARPQIEKMVLSERQVEFLQRERERLYNEAVQERKIKFN